MSSSNLASSPPTARIAISTIAFRALRDGGLGIAQPWRDADRRPVAKRNAPAKHNIVIRATMRGCEDSKAPLRETDHEPEVRNLPRHQLPRHVPRPLRAVEVPPQAAQADGAGAVARHPRHPRRPLSPVTPPRAAARHPPRCRSRRSARRCRRTGSRATAARAASPARAGSSPSAPPPAAPGTRRAGRSG